MEYPLVTVFTLIYNTNPRYVIEAIESVRDNNYPKLQHIIIDDCSPDASPKETVKAWIEKEKYPCEFYEHEVNFGICKTLNHVLELTKGEYLIGCCDDLLLPKTILSLVNVHLLDQSIGIAFGNVQMVVNEKINTKIYPTNEDFPIDKEYVELQDLIKSNCVNAISTMYRMEALNKIGGFENSWIFEDYPINIKLVLEKWKIFHVKKVLGYYRIHDNNISHKINYNIADFTVLNYFKKNKAIHKELLIRLFGLITKNISQFKKCLKIYLNLKNRV